MSSSAKPLVVFFLAVSISSLQIEGSDRLSFSKVSANTNNYNGENHLSETSTTEDIAAETSPLGEDKIQYDPNSEESVAPPQQPSSSVSDNEFSGNGLFDSNGNESAATFDTISNNIDNYGFDTKNKDLNGDFNSPDEIKDVNGDFNSPDEIKEVNGDANSPDEIKDVNGDANVVNGDDNSPDEIKDVNGDPNSPDEIKDVNGDANSPDEIKDVNGDANNPDEIKDLNGDVNNPDKMKDLNGNANNPDEIKQQGMSDTSVLDYGLINEILKSSNGNETADETAEKGNTESESETSDAKPNQFNSLEDYEKQLRKEGYIP